MKIRTDPELQKLRTRAVDTLSELHKDSGASPEFKDPKFTCDICSLVRVCGYAYDPYNTEGDCIYDK